MLKKLLTTLFLCLFFTTAYAWEIVKDGKAQAVIVIPADAVPVEDYAAKELQYIIKKSTGAELPIVKGKASGKCILIGRAANLPKDKFAVGKYMIKSTADTLILAGWDSDTPITHSVTASGSLYAVYKWAEDEMKVFWIWPDEKGEVIPAYKNIDSGRYDLMITPKLHFARVRRWDWKWNRRMLRADYSRHIRNTGAVSTGHAFIDWVERYWKSNPEYFAMNEDGKRYNNGKYSPMCVSNPAFHQQIVKNWLAAGKPDHAVNVKENDVHGLCCCKNCLAWDADADRRWPFGHYGRVRNVGERYAKYYLAVQKEARKTHPDAKVEAYAYNNYVYAPVKTKLNPDIIVGFVDDIQYPRTPETQEKVNYELRQWKKSGATIYWRPNTLYQSYVAPQLFFRQFAEQFRLISECGNIGLDVDGPNNSWATVGVNLFVLSRLVADPDKSVDEYLDQYCSAFGKAAPAIRKYIDYWEKYTMSNAEKFDRVYMEKTTSQFFLFGWDDPLLVHYMYPLSVFAPAAKILDEAMLLAKGDPIAEYRVRFLYQGLIHAKYCIDASRIFADEKSSNKQRTAILNTIVNYRKRMLPNVADIHYFEETYRNEGKHWKLHTVDLNEALALPEMWQVMVGKEEVKAAYNAGQFAGSRELSTRKFVEDQGIKDYKYVWYRTTFAIPAAEKGRNAIIRLGAVDETCICKVNGKVAGTLVFNAKENPESWKMPLEFDITKLINPDGVNTIDLLVVNASGKGGLWKQSYIRFEQPGTGKIIRPILFRGSANGFFSQRKDGKAVVSVIKGNPELGSKNKWLTAIAPIGFGNVAGKSFRLKATCRTMKLHEGEFRVMIRQVGKNNTTIAYNGFIFKRSSDWEHYTETVKVSDKTVTLYIYLIGMNMNKGATGEVKNISIELLK
jgi:hypothetical protein